MYEINEFAKEFEKVFEELNWEFKGLYYPDFDNPETRYQSFHSYSREEYESLCTFVESTPEEDDFFLRGIFLVSGSSGTAVIVAEIPKSESED